MKRRFEIRRREILDQARIPPQVVEGMLGRLVEFAEPFCGLLWRKEQKEHLKTYLQGLLSDLASRNVESIAYLHDQDRICLQKFIGWSSWDHRPLMDELSRQVAEKIGSPTGVIVFDPSAHRKYGPHSVGVKRQWCGRLGKVENCQVGVYMGYVGEEEHALVDFRLYLPREWAEDRKRRKKCGVPKEVRYRKRHALALDFDRARDAAHSRFSRRDDTRTVHTMAVIG